MASTGPVLRRVLSNARLRRAELAFAGFALAEFAVWTAILVYAFQRGGTTATGVIAVVQLAPAALVAPFASGLTDRRGGAYALFYGYVLQAGATGAAAVVILAGGPALVVYVFAIVAASAVTLTRPAQTKLVCALADHPDELTGATAMANWIEAASALGGPLLAGLWLAVDGPGIVLAVSALSLAASALAVAPFLNLPQRRPVSPDEKDVEEGVRAGIKALRCEPSSRALVLIIGAEYLAIGALDVLVVVLAISTLGLGSPSAGYLNAAFGLGATLGGMAGVALAGARRVARPLIGAALGWAACFVALGALQTSASAFLLLPLAGVCRSVLDTGGRALLARVTPHDVLARVFGVMEGLMMAALGVGSLIVPILVGLGGVGAALTGVAVVLATAALLPIRSLRRLDTRAPAAAIASLRRHELFAPLPPPVLEGLARELKPIDSPAGDQVIVQGELGDRFYLIISGAYDVTINGSFIRTLETPDGFGEIALLSDVPRTASITTRTEGVLYGLDRAPFLDALRPAV